MADQENWEYVAKKLWDLLDGIDTLGDSLKPEINGYFRNVQYRCEQRHKYLQTDGYGLFMKEGVSDE